MENKSIYEEAMDYLSNGDYGAANDRFNSILDYKDVRKIKEQMYYETIAFQCFQSLDGMLDIQSFSINDMKYFKAEFNDVAYIQDEWKSLYNYNVSESDINGLLEVIKTLSESESVPIVLCEIENESLGTAYILFAVYDNRYSPIGSCYESYYSNSDEQKNIYDVMHVIELVYKTQGSFNLGRINNVLKSGKYSSTEILNYE